MSTQKTIINFGELSTEVESRLGFAPDADVDNGICLAEITNVSFEEYENPSIMEDGSVSNYEFAGLNMPVLRIEFKQILDGVRANESRYLTIKENPIVTTKNNKEQVSASTWISLVKNQFAKLQHILNQLDKNNVGKRSATKLEGSPDYDSAPELRIAESRKLLTYFYDQFVGADPEKPRYVGSMFWLKVVAERTKGTYYEVPAFVGKGWIELVKQGVPCTLSLAPNETIELKSNVKESNKTADVNYKDSDATASENVKTTANSVLARLNLKR